MGRNFVEPSADALIEPASVQEFEHWLIATIGGERVEIPCENFEITGNSVRARIWLDPGLFDEDLHRRILVVDGVQIFRHYWYREQCGGLQGLDVELLIEQFPALCPQTWFAIVPQSSLVGLRLLGGGELGYLNRCEFLAFWGCLFARSGDSNNYYKVEATSTSYECGRLRVKIREHKLAVGTSPHGGAEILTREGFRLPWLSWGNDAITFGPWTNLEYWMDFIADVAGFTSYPAGGRHPIEGQVIPTAFHVLEFKITQPERIQYETRRRTISFDDPYELSDRDLAEQSLYAQHENVIREERFIRQVLRLDSQLQRRRSIEQKCHGCKNHHGQTHGGNRLVCGVHPKGYDKGETCPDSEQ